MTGPGIFVKGCGKLKVLYCFYRKKKYITFTPYSLLTKSYLKKVNLTVFKYYKQTV